MLLTDKVEVLLHGDRIKYYENLGYIIPRVETVKKYKGKTIKYLSVPKGSKIFINVDDLSKKSNVKILVKCDNCECEYSIPYKNYLEHKDYEFGDLCKKCSKLKRERTVNERYGVSNVSKISEVREKVKFTMIEKYGKNYCEVISENLKESILKKYGVENISKLEEIKDKKKQTLLNNYGTTNPFEIQNIKEKTMQTNIEKYGVKYPLQNQFIFEKSLNTRMKKGTYKTSKPQKSLFNIIKEEYNNCYMNYCFGKYSFDCFVEQNNVKIDVEFDGQYWHSSEYAKQKDSERDNFCLSNGIKIFRIKGNNKIPNKNDVVEAINDLLYGNCLYKEIYTDWKL